jgi:Zn-dependent protease
MPFDEQTIILRVTFLIPLILSLSVHEWAHAWAAWRLGDDTAKLLGRMTLNPLAHIDPLGTFLLPLLGVPFGWAKPVPINPVRFRGVSMTTGVMLTAAAGPISNVVLCAISTAMLAIMARLRPGLVEAGSGPAVLLETLIIMNLILALFNLLPFPPLDGSRIVEGLLHGRLRGQWEAFTRIAPVLLLVVLFAPVLLHVNLFRWPMEFVARLVGMLTGR